MSLIQINRNPSPTQLTQFGVILGFILPVIGWWWSQRYEVAMFLVGIGLAIAVVAWFRSQYFAWPFLVLSFITAPIGMVVAELVMMLIFVFVFVPIGAVFRLTKRDRLMLRRSDSTESYWLDKQQPKSIRSYYQQS